MSFNGSDGSNGVKLSSTDVRLRVIQRDVENLRCDTRQEFVDLRDITKQLGQELARISQTITKIWDKVK